MGLIELLILLVIAGICGVIAEWVVGFSPGGFVVSIVVGVIGAYLGSTIARALNAPSFFAVSQLIPNVAFDFDIIWAIIGSLLLVALIKGVRSGGRGRRRGRFF